MLRSFLPALVWACALGAFVWLGGVAIGVGRWTAFAVGAAAGLAVFLSVRLYAESSSRP
jgi:hypothetical protein